MNGLFPYFADIQDSSRDLIQRGVSHTFHRHTDTQTFGWTHADSAGTDDCWDAREDMRCKFVMEIHTFFFGTHCSLIFLLRFAEILQSMRCFFVTVLPFLQPQFS